MSSTDPTFYASLLRMSQTATEAGVGKIRPSTSVVPWRHGPDGVEVWWVRRAPTMRFMAGFWAFPGGGLSRSDAQVPGSTGLDAQVQGASTSSYTRASPELDDDALRAVGPDLVPGTAAGALRELFEETGLLWLRGGAPDPDLLAEERLRLLRNEVDFPTQVAEHGWQLDASDLVFAGRWLTPPFAPMRFDNRFFLLHWPDDADLQPCLPEGVRAEHDVAEWIHPAEALARWRAGEILAAPPILHILRVVGETDPASDVSLRRLRHTEEADLGPMRRIEFRPGVLLLPLRTPTLPPATHTNAFLLGHRETVLIDPSTPLPAEQEMLLQVLDAARAQGRTFRAIWLTHHHPDHVGAVEVARRHLDVPVLAHPADAETLRAQGLSIDDVLEDGQRVVLDGDPPLPVRVVHTPGHTRGHLCFLEETTGSLLAGDLTSTLSTIVIDPPDGDMDDYLASLEKAADLGPSILFPSHGPGHPQAVEHLRELRAHRLEREAKALAAWNDGLTTARAMVARVYDDVPPEVHPVAERQIEAHLGRLRKLGSIG